MRTISTVYGAPASRFEMMVERVHELPRWIAISLAVLVVASPFAIAYLEGSLTTVLSNGGWRALIEHSAIIIYSLAVAPVMLQSQTKIAEGMRPVVQLDDDEFNRLVVDTCQISSRAELVAIGVGIVAAVAVGRPERLLVEPGVLTAYIMLLLLLEFGLIAWWLYIAFVNTRLTAVLHRQPLQIDIFDITPFEPVGRQSLVLAVLFIGGISIGLLIGYARQDFLSWQTLVIYPTFVVIAVLLFVLNMRHTHDVLAQTKQEELAETQRSIVRDYRMMKELAAEGADTQVVAGNINAWVAMEQRLKLTRTWPYNTEMLRTLFISTLMPFFVGLSKLVSVLISSGRL